MKPHPKIRKFARWAGTGFSAALIVIWVLSGEWIFKYADSSKCFTIENGGLWVSLGKQIANPTDFPNGLTRYTNGSYSMAWGLFEYGPSSVATGRLRIPCWWLFALTAFPTIYLWRLDLRARRLGLQGKCVRCCFDLTGLAPDALCPECGRKPGDADPSSQMYSTQSRVAGTIILITSYLLPVMCFGLSKLDDKNMGAFVLSAVFAVPTAAFGRKLLSRSGRGVLMAVMHSVLVLGLHLVLFVAAFLMFGHGGF